MATTIKESHKYFIALENTGEVLKFPLITQKGSIQDDNTEEEIYISSKDIGFPDIVVKSTNTQVSKLCKKCAKLGRANACRMMNDIYKEIKDKNVDQLYQEKGTEWQNLVDDIVLFYCARFAAFKMRMPVVDKSTILNLDEA